MEMPEVLISEGLIRKRVEELAWMISEEYKGVDNLLVLGVLRGCYMFMADLTRMLTVPRQVDFLAVSSYGDTTAAGPVRLIMDTRKDVTGKHVLLVDDIIDTGTTLQYLTETLKARNPASLKTCVFLRKEERLETDAKVDFIGFDIPDVWVVGYGLDRGDDYRALPYIGEVSGD